jgi:hypothetical protein
MSSFCVLNSVFRGPYSSALTGYNRMHFGRLGCALEPRRSVIFSCIVF